MSLKRKIYIGPILVANHFKGDAYDLCYDQLTTWHETNKPLPKNKTFFIPNVSYEGEPYLGSETEEFDGFYLFEDIDQEKEKEALKVHFAEEIENVKNHSKSYEITWGMLGGFA